MLPDRYYVAEVQDGAKLHRLYFYANVEGLTDPEYGYTEDNSWIEPQYRQAVDEIKRISAKPGETVTVGEPREISSEELVRRDPEVNVHVVKAISLAKEEISEALHPIRVIWYWQASDDVGEETAVYLKLADDTVSLSACFGLPLQQLSDESLMRERIRRLYQDLLARRTRTLILNLLRRKAGAGKA